MKRRTNLINNVLSLALTLGSIFVVLYLSNTMGQFDAIVAIALFVSGSIVAGLVNAFAHELGHVIAGKLNDFTIVSVTVWFFKWTKRKNKMYFNLVMIGDEAGSTETVSNKLDNLEKRFKKQTAGGIIASFIMMVIGVVPVALYQFIPYHAFCIIGMFFPLGVYYFLGNALPMANEGIRNDGGVIYGINKGDDNAKVMLSLLTIQSELLNGKTPKEIDEKYYFDLPQLPENDMYFPILLNARFSYYLDKEDYENAKKVAERERQIAEDMPKAIAPQFYVDCLYASCTFAYNENTADDLMYECEKYLNKINTATNIRVKMAYLTYVVKEKEGLEIFYEKGLREIKRSPIKGYGVLEQKLLDKIMLDAQRLESNPSEIEQ